MKYELPEDRKVYVGKADPSLAASAEVNGSVGGDFCDAFFSLCGSDPEGVWVSGVVVYTTLPVDDDDDAADMASETIGECVDSIGLRETLGI